MTPPMSLVILPLATLVLFVLGAKVSFLNICSSSLPPNSVAKRGPPAEAGATGASPLVAALPSDDGVLQKRAARIIMKLYYAARTARFDLLRPIGFLATYTGARRLEPAKGSHRHQTFF